MTEPEHQAGGFAGWAGEPPEETQPAGFAGFLLAHRAAPGEGRTLEQVFQRAARPDRPPEPYDPDDHIAAMVSRGLAPGMITDLALKLADTEAQLAGERDKIEAGKRRQEHIRRAHQAGQASVFDIMRMQDFDEGDPGVVERLEGRAALLRRQLGEAQAMMAGPAQRAPDPAQAAVARAQAAHREYVARSRAAWQQAQGGTGPRPFSASRGVVARTEPVTCDVCVSMGASPEESFLIHHMDADGNPLAASPGVPVRVPPDDSERSAAGYGREVTRACR